jgi:hypothetical protein
LYLRGITPDPALTTFTNGKGCITTERAARGDGGSRVRVVVGIGPRIKLTEGLPGSGWGGPTGEGAGGGGSGPVGAGAGGGNVSCHDTTRGADRDESDEVGGPVKKMRDRRLG